MQPSSPYTPIDCGFHDRLEHWAVTRQPVEITWRDSADTRTSSSRILDVFAKNGADWLRLADGQIVRLDQVVSVNGMKPSEGSIC